MTPPHDQAKLSAAPFSAHERRFAFRLLQGPLTDEELGNHPLMVMLRRHGSRSREDSLL